MESLPDGISSTSKTQSSVPSIGNTTPSTSGTPRSSRPPSPRQSRNGTSSSASSAATTDQGLRPVHQQKQPSKVHESMQHEEELPSSAKQFCDPSNTKPEPVSSGSSGVVDRPVESSSKNTDSVTSVSLQEPQNRAVQSKPICSSPQNSLCAPSVYNEAKQSFTNTEVSECGGESVDVSNSCDFVESRKTSMYRGSTGSDLSDESSSSSLSNAMYKPHKANDVRWEAIQLARHHYGALGVDHFRLINKLGCGDIGSVYLSELKGTRSYFAMKVMDKAKLASRKKLLRAQTEREILQSLDHPFLPTLYTHFETENHSCLVMEYCPGGDLHNLRQRQPGKYFSEHAARFYVAEVLLALEYLHMLGIIYRDLKPENVLVREDGHIMLSDFDLSLRCAVCPTLVKSSNSTFESKSSGYCVQPACIEPSCVIQPDCIQPACFAPRFFRSKKKEKKSKPKNSEVNHQVSPLPELIAEPTSARSMSFVGTHEYLAPEIIKGEGHGSAVDWWTFGIFLYELLFGKTPFKGQGNRATLFNVVGQPLRFPESPSVSFAARDLIRGLLVKEPQHRLAYRRGATEIKQHPFFQSVNWALIRCANPPDVPKPVVLEPPVKASAPPPAPPGAAGEIPGVDMKPAGNYYEIDFF